MQEAQTGSSGTLIAVEHGQTMITGTNQQEVHDV